MQHRLWSDHSIAHLKRAGFRPGQTLLDLGCGPGFVTYDLAEFIGPEGTVIAVEREPKYAAFLRRALEQPLQRPRAPIDLRERSAEDPGLAPGSLDGAYARWVFTFLTDLPKVLGHLHRALRPGGALAIMDYFDWSGLAWGPRRQTLQDIRAGVSATFDDFGADGCVGQKLPAALTASGFELVEVRPIVHIVRPHDALWTWPEVWMRGFLPTVVAQGHLRQEVLDAWRVEWASNAKDPAGLFMTPPQVEIVARKPRETP